MIWWKAEILIPNAKAREMAARELSKQLMFLLGPAPYIEITGRQGDPILDMLHTFQRAESSGRDFVIIMEDDVWPAPDFYFTLPIRMDEAPTDIVSFFTFQKAYAQDGFHRVRKPKDFLFSQCVAFRTRDIQGLAQFAAEWYADRPNRSMNTDSVYGHWAHAHELSIGMSVPSLVQHRIGPSTSGRKAHRRQSPSFTALYGDVPPMPKEIHP